MSRISIPIDALTSRLNFSERMGNVGSQSMTQRMASLRPVSEFFDFKRLSKPANFGEVQSRVSFNLGHFATNYMVLFVMLAIYGLLTNPALLFVIVFSIVGMFLIGRLNGQDLDLGFARATTSQLYTGLLVIAVPIGFWSSPFAFAMWLIGASGVTILGHASFMDKPIESAFQEEAV